MSLCTYIDEYCRQCKSTTGLLTCGQCKSAKYCSIQCQKDDREDHKFLCKTFTIIQLPLLAGNSNFSFPQRGDVAGCSVVTEFKLPPPPPICAICRYTMRLVQQEQYLPCCGQRLCHGCARENQREKCPFCKAEFQGSYDENWDRAELRPDAESIYMVGNRLTDPHAKLQKIIISADAGYFLAKNNLATRYLYGEGGLSTNREAALKLYLEAAEMGHTGSRYAAAMIYKSNHNILTATAHFAISASLGHDGALKELLWAYITGVSVIPRKILERLIKIHHGYKAFCDSLSRERAANHVKRRY